MTCSAQSIFEEATALVRWLLEGLTVEVLWHNQKRIVPAVLLERAHHWTAMTSEGHGIQRWNERVEQRYRLEFFEALESMQHVRVPVPASGRWALKMPNGYALFGTGDQAISCASRLEKISDDQQLVENPVMDAYQRRRWEVARKGL